MTTPDNEPYVKHDRPWFGSPWCLHWRGGRYWFGVRTGRFRPGLRRHTASTRRVCIHWWVYGGPDAR